MDWIGGIIGWVIFGAIAGVIARMLHPGNDAMGMVPTILLGITGSLVGGVISYLLQPRHLALPAEQLDSLDHRGDPPPLDGVLHEPIEGGPVLRASNGRGTHGPVGTPRRRHSGGPFFLADVYGGSVLLFHPLAGS